VHSGVCFLDLFLIIELLLTLILAINFGVGVEVSGQSHLLLVEVVDVDEEVDDTDIKQVLVNK